MAVKGVHKRGLRPNNGNESDAKSARAKALSQTRRGTVLGPQALQALVGQQQGLTVCLLACTVKFGKQVRLKGRPVVRQSSVQNFLQNAFMAAVGLAGRAWRLRVSASARPARRRQAASA
ncbi:hypothetical protein, partial [Aquibaculum arenosum]|uniref:hypothetical protein n=1 Tax=Aquibaculum arenosum TaxID=3032591 RepID=UPI0023DCBCCB